ncbi:MULE transposase [Hirsutella rhossiliensis]
MDNTYKVNRFNMPLLQIIGTTGLHKSFSVGFGLTAKEDEGAFQWILSQLREAGRQADIPDPGVVITDFDTALKNALDSIFPSTQQQVILDGTEIGGDSQNRRLASLQQPLSTTLYRQIMPLTRTDLSTVPLITRFNMPHNWQISALSNKMIVKMTMETNTTPAPRRTFEHTADGIRDAWVSVFRARTAEECRDQWDLLCIEFSDQPALVNYLRTTYWPWRAQFSTYAIQQYRNYNITVTSRVEHTSRVEVTITQPLH